MDAIQAIYEAAAAESVSTLRPTYSLCFAAYKIRNHEFHFVEPGNIGALVKT